MNDAVVVCSGIGQAIVPERTTTTSKCPRCNIVPPGCDYLVAPLPCLKQLVRRNGAKLEDMEHNGQVRLGQSEVWAMVGNPFQSCQHDGKSASTCWDRIVIFQQVQPNGFLAKAQISHKATQSDQMPLSPNGAVVFGNPRTEKTFPLLSHRSGSPKAAGRKAQEASG